MLNRLLLERFVAQANIAHFETALRNGQLHEQQAHTVTEFLARAKQTLAELDQQVAALVLTLQDGTARPSPGVET